MILDQNVTYSRSLKTIANVFNEDLSDFSSSSNSKKRVEFINKINDLFTMHSRFFIQADIPKLKEFATIFSSDWWYGIGKVEDLKNSIKNSVNRKLKLYQNFDMFSNLGHIGSHPSDNPRELFADQIKNKMFIESNKTLADQIENPTKQISITELKKMLSLCGHLIKELDFALLIASVDSFYISFEVLGDLMSCCPNLEKLTLYNQIEVNFKNLRSCLEFTPNLKEVTIAGCSGFVFTKESWDQTFPKTTVEVVPQRIASNAVAQNIKLSTISSLDSEDQEVISWTSELVKHGILLKTVLNYPKETRVLLMNFVKSWGFNQELKLFNLPGKKLNLSEFTFLNKDKQNLVSNNPVIFCRMLDTHSFVEMNSLSEDDFKKLFSFNKNYIDFVNKINQKITTSIIAYDIPCEDRKIIADNSDLFFTLILKVNCWHWITTLPKDGITLEKYLTFPFSTQIKLVEFVTTLRRDNLNVGKKINLIEFAELPSETQQIICADVPGFCRSLDTHSFAEMQKMNKTDFYQLVKLNYEFASFIESIKKENVNRKLDGMGRNTNLNHISTKDIEETPNAIRIKIIENKFEVQDKLFEGESWKSICEDLQIKHKIKY